MRALEDIVHASYDRAMSMSEYTEALRTIDLGYEGKLDVDLPELRRREKVAVANMIVSGIDQHGMRIASTMFDLVCPPLRTVGTSANRASRRRQAMFGWLDENAVDVQLHRRARWLIAYARAPIQIVPRRLRRGDPLWTPENEWTVEWRLRAPHDTFPNPSANPDDMTPSDCIFRYSQSLRWVGQMYPDAASAVRAYVRAGLPGGFTDDTMVELIEYVDGEETVLAATGNADSGVPALGLPREGDYGRTTITRIDGGSAGQRFWGVELDRYPNRTGLCPVVIPGRITLGRPQGQFDQMIGLYEQQAHLMALELIAVRRSVSPDTWIESNENEQMKVPVVANGLLGRVGQIQGGRIREMNLQPGFQTYPTIDRLSESMRQQALIPPDFGGQSGSNIRTARRGAEIIASTVDFSIQEAQLLFQRSAKHELTRAVETAKAYFRRQRKLFHVGWPGAKGTVDYTPGEVFEDGATFTVEYAAIGSDANQLSLRVIQAVGSGLMSKQTARRMHPDIENEDGEDRQADVEQLRAALLNAFEQKVVGGGVAEKDVIATIRARLNGDTVEDAVEVADRAAQQRQASSGAPGTPEGPVDPNSPEAQPGIAAPGIGAEAAAIPPSTPSRDHLAQLLHQVATARSASAA